VFEIPGVDEKSVVVLSKQDFDSWQETIHLLSSPANAQALLEPIAELDAK
jgi:antitoxin YefM